MGEATLEQIVFRPQQQVVAANGPVSGAEAEAVAPSGDQDNNEEDLCAITTTEAHKWKGDPVVIAEELLLSLRSHHNFEILTKVVVGRGIHIIEANFFTGIAKLRSVDLSSATSLREVGNNFLVGCTALTSLSLPPAASVSKIGDFFLYGCEAITSLDLSDSSALETVGSFFLANCLALTTLQLPHNLRSVGERFLHGCASLLSPLTIPDSLTIINDTFLSECRSITTVQLPRNLTQVGEDFMRHCTALTSPLELPATLTSVGNTFLCELSCVDDTYCAEWAQEYR